MIPYLERKTIRKAAEGAANGASGAREALAKAVNYAVDFVANKEREAVLKGQRQSATHESYPSHQSSSSYAPEHH